MNIFLCNPTHALNLTKQLGQLACFDGSYAQRTWYQWVGVEANLFGVLMLLVNAISQQECWP